MTVKDLTRYLPGDLVLPYKGKEYRVPPPNREVGLQLTAINAMGVAAYQSSLESCPTCGRSGAVEVPEETREVVAALEHVSLGELSLGPAFAELEADKVPAAHVDQFALYALYFWTLGEETADAIFEAQAGGGAPGEARASASSTSTRGPRTASESRTPTASTRGTAGRRKR